MARSATPSATASASVERRVLVIRSRAASGRTTSARKASSPTDTIVGEEDDPAQDDERRLRSRLRQRRELELRRRPRVRSHREGEGAAHGVAVLGDDPPEHEVPAAMHVLQRDDELVRVRLRARRRGGDDAVVLRVSHEDDREPRLDRLAVGEAHRSRRIGRPRGSPTVRCAGARRARTPAPERGALRRRRSRSRPRGAC